MIKLKRIIAYNIIKKLALSQKKTERFENNSYLNISNIGYRIYNLKH